MINAKFKQCQFVAGASSKEQIPVHFRINEVAFAGRANVGKSSLLNGLTFQRNLAKTSKTPGRTQQINFFCINDFITLVDLPGYGYSKVAKNQINNWSKLIAWYISSRSQLKQLFLLIDCRRGLMKQDLTVINWLESYNIDYQIVLTKTDKIKPAELEEVTVQIKQSLATNITITNTSTKDSVGLQELRAVISQFSHTS